MPSSRHVCSFTKSNRAQRVDRLDCFSEPNSEEQIRHWVEMGLETSPDIILAMIEADRPDGEEERRLIAALTTPVLVIHGTDDQVIPLARAEELARLTGGQLAVVGGSGHEPQYRHPDEVNTVLGAFLDEHYPPDARPASV